MVVKDIFSRRRSLSSHSSVVGVIVVVIVVLVVVVLVVVTDVHGPIPPQARRQLPKVSSVEEEGPLSAARLKGLRAVCSRDSVVEVE